MKAIVLLLLMFFSCKPHFKSEPEQVDSATIAESYLFDHSRLSQDTTYIEIVSCDSLLMVIDSLKTQLFLSNYKVEKVKYYLKIVDKNPSQVKFLRGWMRRAVE